MVLGGFNSIGQKRRLGNPLTAVSEYPMGEIESELPKRRPKTAMVLYMLSTWLYIFFVAFLIMFFLEVWKGMELLVEQIKLYLRKWIIKYLLLQEVSWLG